MISHRCYRRVVTFFKELLCYVNLLLLMCDTGVNVDLSNQLMQPDQARFIKNLVYSIDDASLASNSQLAQTGVFKPQQSSSLYLSDFQLPEGYNQTIGYLSVKETKEVYVNVYNSNSNHTIYKLNGYDGTYNILYQGSYLNFSLNPENFIHQGGAYLNITYITDPVTGLQKKRSFYIFTDGGNFQRQICVEDSVATNGFNATLFPYFAGNYDQSAFLNMGVPTPMDCIQVSEVPRTSADVGLTNALLFKVWYFRIKVTDVWGRPSEHGIISDAYIPGINDCIGASSSLPRCVTLTFPAPNPFIDSIQVEYMRCGDTEWSISDTIFLYDGSSLGEWWTRKRADLSPYNAVYNQGNNTITYTFCANEECEPIPISETSRLYNPLPRQSQGVTKIWDYISLTNNKDGFLPLTQEQKSGIKFNVIPPKTVGLDTASIDILVPIYNPALNNFQSVFKNGTKNYEWGDNNSKHGGAAAYKQAFKNPNQSGFGGYLVGQGNFVISTQWYVNAQGQFVQDTELDGKGIAPSGVTFLRFQFNNIPKGKYVFRLMSHLADPTTDVGWQATSTTVWGVCPFQPSSYQVTPQNRTSVFELLIDVCNQNYSSLNDTKVLCICDLAAFDPYGGKNLGDLFGGFNVNTGVSFQAVCGYIYETNVNGVDQRPMELMTVTNPHGLSYSSQSTSFSGAGTVGLTNPFATSTFTSVVTDHNGFYYFSTEGTDYTFAFGFEYRCAKTAFGGVHTEGAGLKFKDPIVIEQIEDNGHFPWADYSSVLCNRVLVQGQVVLEPQGIGVPNVNVVLTRGQTAITDSDGKFTIMAHDDILTGIRNDEVIISGGGCGYTSPDGSCITIQDISFTPCVTCGSRVITINNTLLSYSSKRGLLSGGTYSGGVVLWDWVRRCGYVQQIQNITIPSITQSQTIAPSTIEVTINPNTVFPSDFSMMTVWLTRETTIEKYVDWIVDLVEFIDNTGNINTVSPTQIRIYYGSLLEYNKQNNYNTTVNWDFLEPLPANATSTTTQTPYQTDTVQFFVNGDGTFFFDGKQHPSTDIPVNITSLVKYDQTGQYFLIDYDSSLAGLLPNSLIRLSRPKVCTGNEEFFELCTPIPLVNGSTNIGTFVLNAFDTYYLPRSIPVPTPVNPSNTSTISTTTKTTNNSDGSQTVVTQTTNETVNTVDEQRQFGFPFEHNAPSNFWGSGCFNGGRGNVKNPYETIIYSRDQFALSGSSNQTGQLNYSNYFDDSQKFSFPSVNGIVGAYPQSGQVLVIGQSNWFVVGFNDNVVRVNAEGQAIAPSIANTFGQPNAKIGNEYGCQLFDKSTIAVREGTVVFLDTERSALLINDYRTSNPISANGMNSYFTPKIKAVQNYNLFCGNTRYFVGVIDPSNNSYLLTDYVIKSGNFLNNLRDTNVSVQETISVGVFTGQIKGWYSQTPEFYAYLDGEINDQQLFSFLNGVPYKHYKTSGNITYGQMYGSTIGRNIRFVSAQDPLKKKKFTSWASYCKQGAYFCDEVVTEIGQLSRTLLANITSADFGFYGAFLCDLNTLPDPNQPSQTGENALMDGDMLVGLYAIVDMVGDPNFDNVYSELNGFVVNFESSEKSGI